MARTRRSLAGAPGETGENSQAAQTKSSAPASEPSASNSLPVKRGRGRPSKASLAAAAAAANTRESLSSIATSTYSSADSVSGYSTPLTSNVTTPAPVEKAASVDKGKSASTRSTRSSKLEVVISAVKSRGSATKFNSKAGESLMDTSARSSRRNRLAAVPDSEDADFFDDSPNARRIRIDEQVARSLQDELNREVEGLLSDHGPQEQSMIGSDSEDYAVADPKGKGKAVATRRAPGSRAAAKKRVVQDSDSVIDDDDDDNDSDFADLAPPAKKQKTAVRGRGKQASAKGKKSVHTNPGSPSDSDEDMPLSKRPNGRKVASRSSAAAENALSMIPGIDEASSDGSVLSDMDSEAFDMESEDDSDDADPSADPTGIQALARRRRGFGAYANRKRIRTGRLQLEEHHPALKTMWDHLENMPVLKAGRAEQPKSISRLLKPFQLEGLAWMKAMEQTEWKGGLLGDEMGLGKTIQAVSLIMSDYPAKQPSLVLVPPVALMQWVSEIESYTDGTLKTLVYHGTNSQVKGKTIKELKKFDVIIMSYNSLESMYRKQEKGFKRKNGLHKEKSLIHAIQFHRVLLDEAHCIKTRTTMTAKACFALKVDYRWCLTGTPLQNRIGEFFSLIRFLNIRPFASYFCKNCTCESLEWTMDEDHRCTQCNHNGMQHVSVFNQELLNPIQRYGNMGPGAEAFRKLRLMTDRIMLRRLKKDHTNSMELPVKEIYVDRQFFGEAENDFANSIMTNGQREFDTYVAHGVLLNNYANIFGLIMQMRQVADHPDLILKKNAEGGQNVLVCCICDEPAEEAIRSRCKHDFCRSCAKSYLSSQDQPDCPQCHIPLSIDLEQPEIEQDEAFVKKSSIINRIKMENWTSSSKIELLVHELHQLRSDKASHKSIIFSQFTTMLQLIEWRLRRAGITTVMLDGSMTPAQRAASIDHFMKNTEVECFLVSLKAGDGGTPLQNGSLLIDVIVLAKRALVQSLVFALKTLSRAAWQKKASMIHSTINNDDTAMESLTPEDLQFLFRGN
ncbi:adenosinetriphosphatase [Diaporthe amygdali]|uniref:adenosinetriphosphatase n=1 Tax=Phomopsis amygdali TaxID=1214568 RepID=UPI0022FDBE45|nr:adenosinetriphosphatase [Diaporthe amygdali]KAJ0117161.1 adenosinetriphosphatase [Diaporthe amygdali]